MQVRLLDFTYMGEQSSICCVNLDSKQLEYRLNEYLW